MWTRREQIAVYDFPREGGGQIAPFAGPVLHVDTENGATQDTAKSWEHSLSTMDAALDKANDFAAKYGSDGVIYLRGHVAEQLTAPLGCYGWKIIGVPGGRPRHATASGVDLNSNGAHWSEASTATNAPLLELREQGWEVHNILFVPESGYSAVKLNRQESATYPDASHFKASGCKFISGGTRVGYGIEDYGGAYHIGVEDCEFVGLEFGYNPTNVSIASPSAQVWKGNTFYSNKHDIVGNFATSQFLGNKFLTVYHATTHPNTLNLAYTADAGVATAKNLVLDNVFADAAADVTIAKGYKPATGDIWRNFVTDTAAYIVTVPS